MQNEEEAKYLGIHIGAEGENKKEFISRIEKRKDLAMRMRRAKLTPEEILIVYNRIWIPQIKYCLTITQFSPDQCKWILSPVLNISLAKLGYNRHMPREVVHGEEKYRGLGMMSTECVHTTEQVQFTMWKLMEGREIGRMMQILLETSQLEAGCEERILEGNMKTWSTLKKTWLVKLWQKISNINRCMYHNKTWTPKRQREGDEYIMDEIKKTV